MLPKVRLHKRNGHRHGPDKTEPSPGEIIRLVHSDRPTSPVISSELLKFSRIVATEAALGPGQSDALRAGPRTEATFDQGQLADVQATLDALEAQADVAARMTTPLVADARRRGSYRPSLWHRLVNLNEITHEALTIARPRLGPLSLECRLDAGLPWIVGDGRQLQEAVVALVRYMARLIADTDPPATITVTTTRQDSVLHGESVAQLCIRAERAAIPDHVLRTVFHAPSGPRAAGKVTEMDLYVASRIVGDHGGAISPAIRPDGGPSFMLEFPTI
jgi:C4-dicarboxylate-specific signal transduction histidine kinase